MEVIKLVFDNDTLEEYEKYYFEQHPRAHKKPIAHPYQESMNVWMIMKRPMMNALKQRWKNFIDWFVANQGYANLHIEECELSFVVYYPNNRRHDIDNSCEKFIIDGLVQGGMIVDDDSKHVTKLTLQCFVDTERPRTEIEIKLTGGEKGNG